MGGGKRVAAPREPERPAQAAAFNASLLRSCGPSHIDLRVHAPAVRKLHLEQDVFSIRRPRRRGVRHAGGGQTGVAGTAEYGNQGYSLMDGEKESVRFRKRIDGNAIREFLLTLRRHCQWRRCWRPRQFEETMMGPTISSRLWAAACWTESKLRCAQRQAVVLAGFLSHLVDYGPAAGDTSALPGGAAGKREAERSNVTIGITRYMRKGEGVSTRPDDSGGSTTPTSALAKGYRSGRTPTPRSSQWSSRLPAGPEVFNTPHPMTEENHRQAWTCTSPLVWATARQEAALLAREAGWLALWKTS